MSTSPVPTVVDVMESIGKINWNEMHLMLRRGHSVGTLLTLGGRSPLYLSRLEKQLAEYVDLLREEMEFGDPATIDDPERILYVHRQLSGLVKDPRRGIEYVAVLALLFDDKSDEDSDYSEY